MIEESEPKFASWMRHHGKLAVLKDDEVDRLERAGAATAGDSRQDVMESMYGRADPKPIGEQKGLPEERREGEQGCAAWRGGRARVEHRPPLPHPAPCVGPSYNAEERARMRLGEELATSGARTALLQGTYYHALEVPPKLGLACQGYKWRQDQSHVEVFVSLPEGAASHKARPCAASERQEAVRMAPWPRAPS